MFQAIQKFCYCLVLLLPIFNMFQTIHKFCYCLVLLLPRFSMFQAIQKFCYCLHLLLPTFNMFQAIHKFCYCLVLFSMFQAIHRFVIVSSYSACFRLFTGLLLSRLIQHVSGYSQVCYCLVLLLPRFSMFHAIQRFVHSLSLLLFYDLIPTCSESTMLRSTCSTSSQVCSFS